MHLKAHYLLLLLLCSGQVRVIGAVQPVAARAGDDVPLPCRCEPAVDLTPLTVEWWQVELKTHPSRYSVYTKCGGEMVNRKSPKRIEMFPDQLRAGNASLTLRHVSLWDNGKYTCVIPDLKTEESLRSAQVTLIVQPSDENMWPLFGMLALGFICANICDRFPRPVQPVVPVVPVTVEDVRLVILNYAEPRPADGAQWTVLDAGEAGEAGDATMQ
uniref:Ig-like domain-containing protein n=1 Tax=Neogobius melanostomus TaxID=47308 RepID=A0A8C6UTD5_9GOBI